MDVAVRENHAEADVHHDELDAVGPYIGVKTAGIEVGNRHHSCEYDRCCKAPAEHHFDKNTYHQHVGGRCNDEKRQERSHVGSAVSESLPQFVWDCVQLCVVHARREEYRKNDRKQVVWYTEDEPVRYPVPVRKFAYTEYTTVPC